jgi:hypothetical protein
VRHEPRLVRRVPRRARQRLRCPRPLQQLPAALPHRVLRRTQGCRHDPPQLGVRPLRRGRRPERGRAGGGQEATPRCEAARRGRARRAPPPEGALEALLPARAGAVKALRARRAPPIAPAVPRPRRRHRRWRLPRRAAARAEHRPERALHQRRAAQLPGARRELDPAAVQPRGGRHPRGRDGAGQDDPDPLVPIGAQSRGPPWAPPGRHAARRAAELGERDQALVAPAQLHPNARLAERARPAAGHGEGAGRYMPPHP